MYSLVMATAWDTSPVASLLYFHIIPYICYTTFTISNRPVYSKASEILSFRVVCPAPFDVRSAKQLAAMFVFSAPYPLLAKKDWGI